MTSDADRRKLSALRVLVAIVVLGGASFGAWALVTHKIRIATAAASSDRLQTPWFGPYVDVSATPTYQFQDPQYNVAKQVVLGFVGSSPAAGCAPTWGGVGTLARAATALDLDRRLLQYRERGDSVVISFGGPTADELATTCTSSTSLVAAYLSVVHYYDVSTVDFDLQGAALLPAVVSRRSSAIAAAQQQLASTGSKLAVWLTVPGDRSGITAAGQAAVDAALAAHVELAGVDVTEMNLGTEGHAPSALVPAVEGALDQAEQQVASIYGKYGAAIDGAEAWNHLGALLMIGQSDVPGEQLTVAGAAQLAAFAADHSLGRLSMWSLNRDAACGTYYAELGVLSGQCSGVAEASLGFSQVLDVLKGSVSGPPMAFAPVVADDPATSPYPIWEPQQTYQAGYKVVWQGEVYQAKWSSTGSAPDTPVQYAYQTPWLLVGPVLPTDRAPTTTTLPRGSYPAWSPKGSYPVGDRVLMNGLPYEAKWYNAGDQPGADPADPASSPWEPLSTVPGEPAGSS